MKKSVLFLVIIILTACNSNKTAEQIKKEIEQKKGKIETLTKEITELENELGTSGVTEETSQKNTPVISREIRYEAFNHFFNANGVVEAIKEAYISPEINGQIEEVFVEEGDYVKQDQLLARLDTKLTDNTIEEVETALELATTVFEKQKELWDKKIGSEIQFLQAKNNKESLESKLETLNTQKGLANIKSPINGIVDKIFLKKGEIVMPGQQYMQVVNLDELYVNVDVSEAYLPAIKKNDPVILSFPTYPGEEEKVMIHRIGNIIEPDNRTFLVQLKINNPGKKYKPNMVAIIQINDFSTDSAIIVPSLIIKEDLVGKYVYLVSVQNGQTTAKKRYIEPGRSYNENTRILSGLNPGDQIIINGFDLVSDGKPIDTIRGL